MHGMEVKRGVEVSSFTSLGKSSRSNALAQFDLENGSISSLVMHAQLCTSQDDLSHPDFPHLNAYIVHHEHPNLELHQLPDQSMEKDIEDYVDDLYFSILIDQEELLPISDDRYAEELQLQECIMSSVLLMASHMSTRARSVTTPTKARTVVVTQSSSSGSSIAQSSTSFCEICMEGKPWAEMFASNNCSHVFCTDCIGRHITAKIQDNPTLITCPGLNCRGVLEPHSCQSIVPNEVFERWGKILCESAMIGIGRIIYCPYKDCQTPLIEDDEELVMEAECPCCRRLFCVQCEVPWHSGVGCSEFQSMSKEERVDLMLVELSKKMKWKRCPSCKFFVERTEGCPHMTCRCKYQFCYTCGKEWSSRHESCYTCK